MQFTPHSPSYLCINYETKNLVNVWSWDLGWGEFPVCVFVTIVTIIMGKLYQNVRRGDGEIFITVSGGKDSAGGKSFQPIQPIILLTSHPRVCYALPTSILSLDI